MPLGFNIFGSSHQADDSPIGKRIGKYEITELVGEGGVAKVYKAADTSLGRDVALKFLDFGGLPADSGDEAEAAKQRFIREARTMARVRHPHVVEIFEAGLEEEIPYIVMEFLTGPSLEKRASEAPGLSYLEICRLASQIVDALRFAWEKHQIIHRDLKPGNIMFADPQTVKLVDMGLAKTTDQESAKAQFATSPGMVLGTMQYMAPEQHLNTTDLDHRADIFSLGAVLCELLTFRRPFDEVNQYKVYQEKLKGLSFEIERYAKKAPTCVIELVYRMLEPDAAERTDSHAEILEVLAAATLELQAQGSAIFRRAEIDPDKTKRPTGTMRLPELTPEAAAMSDDPEAPDNDANAGDDTPRTVDELVEHAAGLEELGGYKLHAMVGHGPAAAVFRASEPGADKEIAIKLFPCPDAESEQRWQGNVAAIGDGVCQLDHGAIGNVIAYGCQPPYSYVVSDLYLGDADRPVNLHEYIRLYGNAESLLDQAQVQEVAAALLGALDYAHQSGVVHGNLKPENVLFDFVAREEDESWQVQMRLTDLAQNAIVPLDPESPQSFCLSPEQAAGQPATVASDVYSLGKILLFCLVGKDSLEPDDSPGNHRAGIHEDWNPIIRKSIREQAERRFTSAAEMAEYVIDMDIV